MTIAMTDTSSTGEQVGIHQDISLFHQVWLTNLNKSALGLEFLQQCRITRLECFRFDRELAEKLQLGGDTDICGLIAISTNAGIVGLKDFALPCNYLRGDLTMWFTLFHRLVGMSLMETIHYVQLKQETWDSIRVELVVSALANLLEKIETSIQGKSNSGDLLNRAYLFDHTQAYISF